MSEKNKSDRSGKDAVRNPDTNAAEESDRREVPEKAANKVKARESPEGRSRTKENTNQFDAGSTQSEQTALTGLERVRQRAKQDKQARFTALLHHLTVDLLRESFRNLKRKAASGVDGQTWEQYEQNLEARLMDLHGRVHRGSYRAKPSRRIYLEKPDGRKRPLGIAVLEDKIVQGAVVEILNAIYEVDFLGFSYGFRPACGAHDALDALSVGRGARAAEHVSMQQSRGVTRMAARWFTYWCLGILPAVTGSIGALAAEAWVPSIPGGMSRSNDLSPSSLCVRIWRRHPIRRAGSSERRELLRGWLIATWSQFTISASNVSIHSRLWPVRCCRMPQRR